jgi:hypothetical protein
MDDCANTNSRKGKQVCDPLEPSHIVFYTQAPITQQEYSGKGANSCNELDCAITLNHKTTFPFRHSRQ